MSEAVSLELEDVAVAIQGQNILRDLSLTIAAGSCIGIIGPNGSGKTTLLQAILGFLPLAQGSIYLGGRDLKTLSSRERAQMIAYVAQEPAAALPFTVESFLQLAFHPWRDSLKLSDWEAHLHALCDGFHVLDKFSRNLSTLSGGERQRVLLLQSLLQRPQLLLLDEITNHLDIYYQLETLQFLKKQSMTRIMVLHDINLAARFCDHLIMLKDGRCIAAGPTAGILTEAAIENLFGVPCEIIRTGRSMHIAMGLLDR